MARVCPGARPAAPLPQLHASSMPRFPRGMRVLFGKLCRRRAQRLIGERRAAGGDDGRAHAVGHRQRAIERHPVAKPAERRADVRVARADRIDDSAAGGARRGMQAIFVDPVRPLRAAGDDHGPSGARKEAAHGGIKRVLAAERERLALVQVEPITSTIFIGRNPL